MGQFAANSTFFNGESERRRFFRLNTTALEEPPSPIPQPLLAFAWLVAQTSFTQFVTENSGYFLAVVVLLCLSALFSGYEAAYLALSNKDQEKIKAQPNRIPEKWLLLFIRTPQHFIATLLIGNNLFNIGVVLIISELLAQLKQMIPLHPTLWTVIDLALITSVLLLVGEITPKVYASRNQWFFLKRFTGAIRLSYFLLYPFSHVLAAGANLFRNRPQQEKQRELTNNELIHAIDLTSDLDSPPEEKQILKALVNLNNIPVRAVMRARVDVVALDMDMTLPEVLEVVNKNGYSRLPVIEEQLDNVRGILYTKDLLGRLDAQDPEDWKTLIREPYFIPESKKINKLLNEFKEKKLHIAIVADEFGGTAGIVTLEDILEEIFGEITDHRNREELYFSQLSDHEFIFDGKTSLLDVCRIAGLDANAFQELQGENDSLGGLILEILGRFPQKGEIIEHAPFRFQAESVTRTLIKRVKFTLLETSDKE